MALYCFTTLPKVKRPQMSGQLIQARLKKWYHGGRIVLVGDSVHKFSPTAGNGLNTGWQGVSVLANLIRRELIKNSEPDNKSLEQA